VSHAGEAGNWPAAVKVVAEWFPEQERALASGIFNSGSSLDAILAPPLVAFMVLRFGWAGEHGFRVRGMLFALLTGWVVDHYSYTPVFIGFGLMPLICALFLWTLLGPLRTPAEPLAAFTTRTL
jgi:membrane-bound metal-dependent hydrolase YbcI (DUF457 family)